MKEYDRTKATQKERLAYLEGLAASRYGMDFHAEQLPYSPKEVAAYNAGVRFGKIFADTERLQRAAVSKPPISWLGPFDF